MVRDRASVSGKKGRRRANAINHARLHARAWSTVIGTSLSIGIASYALAKLDWRILLAGFVQGYAWAWVRRQRAYRAVRVRTCDATTHAPLCSPHTRVDGGGGSHADWPLFLRGAARGYGVFTNGATPVRQATCASGS